MKNNELAIAELRRAYEVFLAASAKVMKSLEVSAAIPPACPTRVATIQDMVAEHYGLSRSVLVSRAKNHFQAQARHVAVALCAEFVPVPDILLASYFHRVHGMARYSKAVVAERAETVPAFARDFAALRARVAAALSSTQLIAA